MRDRTLERLKKIKADCAESIKHYIDRAEYHAQEYARYNELEREHQLLLDIVNEKLTRWDEGLEVVTD